MQTFFRLSGIVVTRSFSPGRISTGIWMMLLGVLAGLCLESCSRSDAVTSLETRWLKIQALPINHDTTLAQLRRELGPESKSGPAPPWDRGEMHKWFIFDCVTEGSPSQYGMLVVYTGNDGRVTNYVKTKPVVGPDSVVTPVKAGAGGLGGDTWVESD
jgi:hypothetical protein